MCSKGFNILDGELQWLMLNKVLIVYIQSVCRFLTAFVCPGFLYTLDLHNFHKITRLTSMGWLLSGETM